MSEILIAIALLCQVHTGLDSMFNVGAAASVQKSCQKTLADCYLKKHRGANKEEKLLECVRDQ